MQRSAQSAPAEWSCGQKFWWICGFFVCLKLWLVGGHDMLAKFRIYDDSLFLELAQHLLNGEWLGPLNYRTLIKGPGYPLFVATAYWLGVSLLAAQQLLYMIASLAVINAIKGLVQNHVVLLLLFVLLLFNPFTYFYPMVGALMRESVYNSFALLFLATMLGMWLRHSRGVASGLLWALVMAVAFAMLWLTREETIWTVPGMLLFGILFILPWRWNNGSSVVYRATLYCIPVIIATGAVYGVSRINAAYYGAPVFIETKSHQFVSAFGGLMNIREDGFQQGKIIGRKSEAAAFAASPAFASLKPYIAKRSKKRPNVFYNWSLRSAVNDAGYYADPADVRPALAFYDRMGAELKAACEAGQIDCFDRSPTLQPPLYPEHKAQFPRSALELAMEAIRFDNLNAKSDEFNSHADMAMLMTFDYVTGENAARKSVHLEQMRPPFASKMLERKEYWMTQIGKAYQQLMPWLLLAAAMLHLVSVVRLLRPAHGEALPLFGLILGGSILGILLILTYVKVTLFDVNRPITVLYPLILLYVVTMLSAVTGWLNRQR